MVSRKKIELTQALAQEVFHYDDGELFWVKPRAKWIKKGSLVGSRRLDGYWETMYGGYRYLIHRLIFFYHKGWWPDLIDHIDQDNTNNRIENLRAASRVDNVYNTSKLWGHNTSGVRGVSWDSRQKRWTARLKHEGKYFFLGYFKTVEEAAIVREQKEKEVLR